VEHWEGWSIGRGGALGGGAFGGKALGGVEHWEWWSIGRGGALGGGALGSRALGGGALHWGVELGDRAVGEEAYVRRGGALVGGGALGG